MQKFFMRLATVFGVGYLPRAPGTWGSLVAVPLAALLMWAGPLWHMAFCILFLPISIYACEIYDRIKGQHDLSEVVVDEVIGLLVTLVWLPLTWQSLLAGFLLFRIFDIWKPFPISYLDEHVKGGVGVVVDDLAAGLVANVILQVVYQKTTWLGLQWIGGVN